LSPSGARRLQPPAIAEKRLQPLSPSGARRLQPPAVAEKRLQPLSPSWARRLQPLSGIAVRRQDFPSSASPFADLAAKNARRPRRPHCVRGGGIPTPVSSLPRPSLIPDTTHPRPA